MSGANLKFVCNPSVAQRVLRFPSSIFVCIVLNLISFFLNDLQMVEFMYPCDFVLDACH